MITTISDTTEMINLLRSRNYEVYRPVNQDVGVPWLCHPLKRKYQRKESNCRWADAGIVRELYRQKLIDFYTRDDCRYVELAVAP